VAVIGQQLEESSNPEINLPNAVNHINEDAIRPMPANPPNQAVGPVRPGPVQRALSLEYLQKASRWILKAGGLTFLTSNLAGFAYFFVVFFEAEWAALVLVKVPCLTSYLAWYWISADDHVRNATDAMFLAQIQKIFSWRIWPQRLREWAASLESDSEQF
jgi:hypothetical protein